MLTKRVKICKEVLKLTSYTSFVLLAMLFAGTQLLAQTIKKNTTVNTSSMPTAAADSTQAAADSSNTSLWVIGASWGNNSSFLGRYQAQRLPFYAADITYKSKSGFWLSGIAYHIPNTANAIDEVDLMAGWSFELGKRLDGSVYYSKFFFSPESQLLKATTANAISGRLGLDWSWIYTQLTPTVTFGGNTDFFLVLDNSRYFELPRLFHKKDYLSIEPRFSVIAGTQTFMESYTASQPAPVFSPSPGPGRPGSGGGTITREYSNTSFNLLTYELAVPVSYTIRSLTLEVIPRYSIPVNQLEGDTSTEQFFLTTSLYVSLQ